MMPVQVIVKFFFNGDLLRGLGLLGFNLESLLGADLLAVFKGGIGLYLLANRFNKLQP